MHPSNSMLWIKTVSCGLKCNVNDLIIYPSLLAHPSWSKNINWICIFSDSYPLFQCNILQRGDQTFISLLKIHLQGRGGRPICISHWASHCVLGDLPFVSYRFPSQCKFNPPASSFDPSSLCLLLSRLLKEGNISSVARSFAGKKVLRFASPCRGLPPPPSLPGTWCSWWRMRPRPQTCFGDRAGLTACHPPSRRSS